MIGVVLGLFILGILFTTLAIGLSEGFLSSPASLCIVIFWVLGILLLVASFATRHNLNLYGLYAPFSSTALALYVAVEFVGGGYLVFLGVSNQISNLGAIDWSLLGVAGFGLVLVVDSWLSYRRAFKKDLTVKKEV